MVVRRDVKPPRPKINPSGRPKSFILGALFADLLFPKFADNYALREQNGGKLQKKRRLRPSAAALCPGPRVAGREMPRRQVICFHNLVAKRQKTGILRSLLTLTLTASESCAKTRGNSPHRRMGKHGKSSPYVAHGSANATYAAPAGDFGSRPLLAAMTTNWRPSIM